MPIEPQDIKHMQSALTLARRGLGQTWPNPSVGAVIVRNGVVIGRGCTSNSGRPHAEINAIRMAKGECKGTTLYVTLEPCSHHGQTPPCVDAIVRCGIKRVVIAAKDPNPKVNGNGIKFLQSKGIEVEVCLFEKEALEINRGFIRTIKRGMPLVSAKIASSADGRIASPAGESKWITSLEARSVGHMLRAKHDAVLTGIGTVIRDNPLLTCRIKGLENRSPVRVVLDTELRIPRDFKIVQSAKKVPLWIFTTAEAAASVKNLAELQKKLNLKLFTVKRNRIGLDLKEVLQKLADEGITRVMVEAGPILTTSFLKQKLVDDIYWFRSSSIIGGDGASVATPLGIKRLSDSLRFTRRSVKQLSTDVLEVYSKN